MGPPGRRPALPQLLQGPLPARARSLPLRPRIQIPPLRQVQVWHRQIRARTTYTRALRSIRACCTRTRMPTPRRGLSRRTRRMQWCLSGGKAGRSSLPVPYLAATAPRPRGAKARRRLRLLPVRANATESGTAARRRPALHPLTARSRPARRACPSARSRHRTLTLRDRSRIPTSTRTASSARATWATGRGAVGP